MAREYLIAMRYAKALLNSINGQSEEIEKVAQDLLRIKELFNMDIARAALQSPAVPMELKEELIVYALAKDKEENPTIKSFLKLLQEARRVSLLPLISDAFTRILLESKGRAYGVLTCANSLSDSELEQITSEMEKYLQKKLELKVQVEPELIGGFTLQIENVLVDLSLKKQVEDLLTFANQ